MKSRIKEVLKYYAEIQKKTNKEIIQQFMQKQQERKKQAELN